MQNKFKIITPSFNNKDFVEYNLASVLNQTYKNYDLLYIDDASTDGTPDIVQDILKDCPNCRLIRNQTNKGALSNYMDNLEGFIEDENDIIIHLDGDDWLFDENVLQKLNDFYNKHDCWMTYGQFVCYDGSEIPTTPYPQGTEYPEFVKTNSLYRRDLWRPSHMRTYRSFLFNKIDRNDLISKIDGKDYWHASDLGMQYPCLEMCGPEKFKAIDFISYAYNMAPKNVIRTKEREHKSNEIFEIEIRNKKKYKQGLSGEKLPQVNVFPVEYYQEYCTIPKDFSFCYGRTFGDFDMTILIDAAIQQYISGEIKIDGNKPIVAALYEQRDYFKRSIFNCVLENSEKFHTILTYDPILLERLSNSVFFPQTFVTQFNMLPNIFGHKPYKSETFESFELPETAFRLYPKTKMVSGIISTKSFLPGHVKRLELVETIKDRIELFGRGTHRPIPSKLDALKDYRFSVAMENVSDENYFSEKIVDCFLTGTIPIYHGCPNIDKFFDVRGILRFDTSDELNSIIDNLSEEKYNSMFEYAKLNFHACFKYPLNNDMAYEMYYKKILKK